MDADTRHKLIAHILGDLDEGESRALEVELAQDAALNSEYARLLRQVRVMQLLPDDDAPGPVVDRLLKTVAADSGAVPHYYKEETATEPQEAPLVQLRRLSATVARVAALLVIAFLFGLAVYVTPEGPEKTIATVTDSSGVMEHVKASELVEARMGEPRTLKFATGEVLLDGGSAVSLRTIKDSNVPGIVVDRGRVIVTASSTPLNLEVAGQHIELDNGGVLAVNYDRAFAHLAPDGSVIEVQRMPIHEVAALGEETYGIQLDTGGLPENVRNFRVTFSGRDLNEREFVQSFVDSARRFGVNLDNDGRHLIYESRSGKFESSDPWALELAVLEGNAWVSNADDNLRLASFDPEALDGRGSGVPNYLSVSPSKPDARNLQNLDGDGMDRAVVWATGLGAGYTDTEFSSEPLPNGSVIYTDKLVLRGHEGERIFVLDGPEFDFPLPGGRMGRLVQTTASGAEFEVKDQPKRVWVPFSKLAERE